MNADIRDIPYLESECSAELGLTKLELKHITADFIETYYLMQALENINCIFFY